MNKIKELLKNEIFFSIVIILITSIFICIPLMNKDIDMTYDDGIQHICRIIGTYQGLQEGNTDIFENFCNNFGYCWNLFYSPVTAFLPLVFKILGVSFSTCIKLFMFCTVFLSGYLMYLCSKKITKNNNIAIIAAVMYILAPYRFTDMYIRNALGELTSFVFLPLVFLGLYNLFYEKDNKKIYIPLVLGSTGLLLTHTIITIYTAIFGLIYILINIKTIINKKNINKKLLKTLIISILLILLITSFFWMPLLELKNSADYEVFKSGRMERTEVLIAYKLDFYRLFFTLKNDYMIYEIGIVVLLGLLLTPLTIKKIKDKEYYKTYLFMLIAGIISCVMTLKIFPFEYLPPVLKMLQFSFRMLEFSSFFFAFVASINIVILSKKFTIKEVLILAIVMIALILPFNSQIRVLENYDEQWLIDTVPVTQKTGRVHAGCASFEYLPSKAFENRNYIETRSQDAIIVSGDAQIETQEKNGSKMSFAIKNIVEEAKIELPYIYYPGYSAILENNGQRQQLKTYESDKGFVQITVSNVEDARIIIEYTGTTLMKISKVISIIGFSIFVLIIVKQRIKI